MTELPDIRIKLTSKYVRDLWQAAASKRGLSMTAFITATVSAELIRTGELNLITTVTPVAESKPKPKPQRVEDPYDVALRRIAQADIYEPDAPVEEDLQARIDRWSE